MRRIAVVFTAIAVFLIVGVAAALAADEYAGPKTWCCGQDAQGSYSQSWYESDFAKSSGGYQTYAGFKRASDYGLQGTSNSNEVTQYQWYAPTTNKAGYCLWQYAGSGSGGCIQST